MSIMNIIDVRILLATFIQLIPLLFSFILFLIFTSESRNIYLIEEIRTMRWHKCLIVVIFLFIIFSVISCINILFNLEYYFSTSVIIINLTIMISQITVTMLLFYLFFIFFIITKDYKKQDRKMMEKQKRR